jgi:hypothetical protein
MDTYIATFNPANVHDQGKPAHGHPIFDIGENKVQIDFMWAPESVSDWARYRTTPERGVKGVIYGNMYSAFGDLINLSIQTAGVQMKTVDGKPVPFSKRKDTELHTLSTDISNYGIDIVKAFYQGAHGSVDGMQIDPVLKQYPGLNKNNIKISDLAHTIKGIAKSFELNGLYGGYGLENYSSADELISAFLERVEQKAEEASNAPKFKKAHTPGEMDMVRSVQQKIAKGLQLVKQAFAESKKIKIGENKKMSAQKLGIFAKGKNKINLWEHDGKVVLVHQGSNRLQESKKSVKETVDALHKKGYVCESVDMITMKNAAGAIMRVMYDTIKGTTTVRDKQGGSHTYEAPGEKVVAALQKKGYQKQEDDFGGLSLVPTDAERQQGLI